MKGAAQPLAAPRADAHTPDAFDRFGCTPATADGAGDIRERGARRRRRTPVPPMLPPRISRQAAAGATGAESVPEAPMLSRRTGSDGRVRLFRAATQSAGRKPLAHRPRSDLDDDRQEDRRRVAAALAAAARAGAIRNAWMPNFHLAEKEIEDLWHYLSAQSVPWRSGAQNPAGPGRIPRRQRDQRQEGLLGSRAASPATPSRDGQRQRAELAGIGSEANRRWLVAFLGDPHAFQPETAMPQYDFDRQQLLDLGDVPRARSWSIRRRQAGAALPPSARKIAAGRRSSSRTAARAATASRAARTRRRSGPSYRHRRQDGGAARLRQCATTAAPAPRLAGGQGTHPRSFRDGLHMPDSASRGADDRLVTALLSYDDGGIPEAYRVGVACGPLPPPGRFG